MSAARRRVKVLKAPLSVAWCVRLCESKYSSQDSNCQNTNSMSRFALDTMHRSTKSVSVSNERNRA